MEVLRGFCQCCVAHQILPVLELAALLEEALGVGMRRSHRVRVRVLVNATTHLLGQVVPIDLELSDARFLCKDVSVQALDDWLLRRVLVELGVVVLDVHVVADAEELLAVLVAAREQDGSDADDVVHWQVLVVWSIALHINIRVSLKVSTFPSVFSCKTS